AVAGIGGELEGAGVEQGDQAAGRGIAPRLLAGAARAVGLGRVDVGDADLLARKPEGVAIDDAGGAGAFGAEREGGEGEDCEGHAGARTAIDRGFLSGQTPAFPPKWRNNAPDYSGLWMNSRRRRRTADTDPAALVRASRAALRQLGRIGGKKPGSRGAAPAAPER